MDEKLNTSTHAFNSVHGITRLLGAAIDSIQDLCTHTLQNGHATLTNCGADYLLLFQDRQRLCIVDT
jgi:hypothetical protein